MKSWPLANNNFNLLDRLKICKFFLNFKNRWTQDKYVREFEDVAAKYVGAKYAVFVSSGSTANELIAQQLKAELINSGEWSMKNKVVFGAVTWQTNCSVWVNLGFEPVFIDINLQDFCFDYGLVEAYLKDNAKQIACLFPTAVLGFTPDIRLLTLISKKYGVKVKMDCCENSEGQFYSHNICGWFTSSTSTFVAHQWSNGQEGGFIFTNSKDEYEYFLLSRAHGLKRNLVPYLHKLDPLVLCKHTNLLVDPQFDFQTLSSNCRNTEIGAFCGLMDSKKWSKHKNIRLDLYKVFKDNLSSDKYYLPENREGVLDVAFCFPIIIKHNDSELVKRVKVLLDSLKIERRSFISGNMLRQKPYRKYGNHLDFPNAEYINEYALYIGLNYDLEESDIIGLCSQLNAI